MLTGADLLAHLYASDVVDAEDVAPVTKTAGGTVAQWRSGAVAPGEAEMNRLFDLRAVVDLARRVMVDSSARSWFRSPNPGLRGESPLDEIADGRHHDAIDLLLAMAEGVTS